MFKKFQIGENTVEAEINAALPYRFNQVFKDNYFHYIGKEIEPGEMLELSQKLLYIVAKAAEKADMNRLSFDDFVGWLEAFMPGDMLDAAPEIIRAVFTREGESVPKL